MMIVFKLQGTEVLIQKIILSDFKRLISVVVLQNRLGEIMKLKNGFILREVAGEIVVVPSGDTLDLNMMITLNETAAFLWKKLENDISKEELANDLFAEYEISQEEAMSNVEKFIENLNEHGFLE